ncbi:MAG: transposase [Chloroflexi bacterium]|nr:MAG: transposase [Chloroflexota bacterium]
MTQENLSFGCCYHLFHSGNPKEAIFRLEEDYHSFLELFRKYVWPIANLYAYCLLPSHFHLLLRIKDKKDIDYVYSNCGMLRGQFSNLFGSYTKHINQRYQRTGILFNGSIREIPRDRDLICDLVVYIHQNPQIYGIVTDFRYWPFSSCYAYLRQDRRSMIAKELLLDPIWYRRIVQEQNLPRLRVRDWEEDAGSY